MKSQPEINIPPPEYVVGEGLPNHIRRCVAWVLWMKCGNRTEAAKEPRVCLRTLRDWLSRYRKQGFKIDQWR